MGLRDIPLTRDVIAVTKLRQGVPGPKVSADSGTRGRTRARISDQVPLVTSKLAQRWYQLFRSQIDSGISLFLPPVSAGGPFHLRNRCYRLYKIPNSTNRCGSASSPGSRLLDNDDRGDEEKDQVRSVFQLFPGSSHCDGRNQRSVTDDGADGISVGDLAVACRCQIMVETITSVSVVHTGPTTKGSADRQLRQIENLRATP